MDIEVALLALKDRSNFKKVKKQTARKKVNL
jgi:hypothetical protein